jgi:hypothetical protein
MIPRVSDPATKPVIATALAAKDLSSRFDEFKVAVTGFCAGFSVCSSKRRVASNEL